MKYVTGKYIMKKTRGFTFIELIIVILIIGVIAAYTIPSYQRNVIVAKRSEAHGVIQQLAAAEEKHNANFNNYTIEIEGSGTDGDSLGMVGAPFLVSPDYNYSIAIAAGTGYTITATAIGNTQINDNYGTNCTVLTLNGLGVKGPLDCWQ